MIVFSLLLILVAVTLLGFGLVGGSSSLLISSIVASLLAAVALVVGARQAAAVRRAATVPAGGAAAPRRPATADPLEPEFHGDVPFAGEDDLEAGRSAGYADSSRDTEEYLTDPDATQRVRPDADLHDAGPQDGGHDDDAVGGRTSSSPAAGPATAGVAPSADDDKAATVISGARVGGPESPGEPGRRPEPADAEPDLRTPSGDPSAAARADLDRRPPDADAVDEFDEPDPDDPDDEPLPQAVRPADAVRVARLDAEVLVVDGRPRYHLAECPHLVGRLTEGLPVAEAVELGFSPCGLCRPVDRLVATTAHR